MTLKIGMIGLDSSRSVAFAELLHCKDHPHYVPGGLITAAYPGGSPDFPFAASRVKGYTAEMADSYGVRIMETPEEVAATADAILLGSADGRVHREQFERLAPYGKPIFIDKPLCTSYEDALRIAELSEQYRVPVMSCSSLRYSEGLETACEEEKRSGKVTGADVYGPMEMQETQEGFFWYGVHTAEMLYRILGIGCREVTVLTEENSDWIMGRWNDGRGGTIRGVRRGGKGFGALRHYPGGKGPHYVEVAKDAKPFYAVQLERIVNFFRTGRADVPLAETLEIVRFLEACNESAACSGQTIRL